VIMNTVSKYIHIVLCILCAWVESALVCCIDNRMRESPNSFVSCSLVVSAIQQPTTRCVNISASSVIWLTALWWKMPLQNGKPKPHQKPFCRCSQQCVNYLIRFYLYILNRATVVKNVLPTTWVLFALKAHL